MTLGGHFPLEDLVSSLVSGMVTPSYHSKHYTEDANRAGKNGTSIITVHFQVL